MTLPHVKVPTLSVSKRFYLHFLQPILAERCFPHIIDIDNFKESVLNHLGSGKLASKKAELAGGAGANATFHSGVGSF